MRDIQPIGDCVFVELDDVRQESSSGLLLTSTSKDRPVTGTVVAHGDGKRHPQTGTHTPISVKKGSKVCFARGMGVEMKLDDKLYLILRETDIFAIL